MQTIFTKILLVCFFSLAAASLLAQNIHVLPTFTAKPLTNYSDRKLNARFPSFAAVQISAKEISAYCKGNGSAKKEFRLQLSEKLNFDLELQPSELVSPDYKLQILTPNGIHTIQSNPGFLYKGINKNGGNVRLAIKEGFISGSIQDNDKEYFIEPLKKYLTEAGSDDFIIYEKGDVVDQKIICDTGSQDSLPSLNNSARIGTADSTSVGACKRIRVLNITDYSIYQHYGESIEAVENFLLANLNNVEGIYTGFNFNRSISADTGNDNIKFEVLASYISTCNTCDLVDSSNFAPAIGYQLKQGLLTNLGYTFPLYLAVAPNFWTMRQLNSSSASILGDAWNGIGILNHHSDDAVYLRLVNAHEMGHRIGCGHDNDYNPSVTGFIMNASANLNATRFSRLSDFGGVNYSSNLRIRTTILDTVYIHSYDCAVACEAVKGLKVRFYDNFDSVKISWIPSPGRFRVNYKLLESAYFDSVNFRLLSDTVVIIKNLLPCTDYSFKIEKECNAGQYGKASIVNFNTTTVKLTDIKPVFIRNDLYDLECLVPVSSGLIRNSTITIDHKPWTYKITENSGKILFSNLFADGARHRIDITDSTNTRYCSGPFYYKAPYYRASSKAILDADFNSCTFPIGWKDTVQQIVSNPPLKGRINISKESPPDGWCIAGTLDSTCMFTYQNFPPSLDPLYGKLIYTSPVIDLSVLSKPLLYFDYVYNVYKINPDSIAGFKLECYDGKNWHQVFADSGRFANSNDITYTNIWDTLPSRIFINIEKYKNSQFKFRFIVNDDSFIDNLGNVQKRFTLFSMDNIRVDGYDSLILTGPDIFSIFPNPAFDFLYIKSNRFINMPLDYKLYDYSGRLVNTGKLNNYQINISLLPRGVYILQLLYSSNLLTTQKILKQ